LGADPKSSTVSEPTRWKYSPKLTWALPLGTAGVVHVAFVHEDDAAIRGLEVQYLHLPAVERR
jgi:hypothetical protein